jgi:phage repressor protein C with HTH and peptisase S24 domain
MDRVELLQKLIDERFGGSQAEFARAIKRAPAQVHQWLKGHRALGDAGARGIEMALELPLGYFDGKGGRQRAVKAVDLDDRAEFAAVRRVKFKLSAGISGFEIEYLNGHRAPIFFRRDWLGQRGLEAAELFAVEINGRSMEPSLFEGDLVVVNTGDQVARDGEVYAFNYEGELLVKRLVREADAWYMRSDNQDKARYGDKLCNDRTRIIGRIVHKQSERI